MIYTGHCYKKEKEGREGVDGIGKEVRGKEGVGREGSLTRTGLHGSGRGVGTRL